MGRPAKGWKLRRPPGELIHRVRFTHAGKQVERSTGEEDDVKAAKRAAEIYVAIVSGSAPGNRGSRENDSREGRLLGPLAQTWLEAASGTTLDRVTVDLYALHVLRHLHPFFRTVEGVTPERVGEYIVARLRQVKPPTIKKELSTLRRLLSTVGVHSEGWPKVPARATGTAHPQGKRAATELSPADVRAILKALPARDRLDRLCRARYCIAYWTALRPETLSCLSVPEHWRRGQGWLEITDAIDKARMARRVPLDRAARLLLHWVAPKVGLVFGPTPDHRIVLRAAAKEALGDRGSTFTPYDLRRARITHWLEESGNLPGTMHLVGHRQAGTTAKYTKPGERAAAAVLAGGRRKR